MKLIVGLGNPGKEYRKTRHNVGFLFLDYIATQLNITEWKKAYQWLFALSEIEGQKVLFLKPQTYMNLSGKSIHACATFYKIDTKDILLITDDIDMAFSKIRYREMGSGGGHNGIISAIESLGTTEIQRIKIGIGRHPNMDAAEWVLSEFSKEELKELPEIFEKAAEKLREKIQPEDHLWKS